MSNDAVVELYSKGLSEGFMHPDGRPRIMSGYRPDAMPAEMADEVKRETRGLAEAIEHTVERNGIVHITQARLQELEAKAALADGRKPDTIEVWCNRLGCTLDKPLAKITLGSIEKLHTDGRRFIQAIAARSPECPHPVIA